MSTRKPPLTTTTSIWPAATVLLLGVGTLAVFMVLNLATNAPVATTTTIPIVVGGLTTQTGPLSGPNMLANCHQDGTPPSNIVGGFLLPVGTRPTGPFDLVNAGAGDFDCHRSFVTATTPSKLLGYFQSQLVARGWNEFSSGAANGNPQLLFQKAGSDTFYWVLGITVNERRGSPVPWTFTIRQNSSSI